MTDRYTPLHSETSGPQSGGAKTARNPKLMPYHGKWGQTHLYTFNDFVFFLQNVYTKSTVVWPHPLPFNVLQMRRIPYKDIHLG